MNINDVIWHIRPTAAKNGGWSVIGEVDLDLGAYENLQWQSSDPMPTLQECLDGAEELKLIKEANLYKEQRAAEYPTLDDLVVALWEKVIENRPETSDALQIKRSQVKAKYPKPA